MALLGCGRIAFDPVSAEIPDAAGRLCDGMTDVLYCSDFERGELGPMFNSGAAFVPGGGHLGSDAFSIRSPPGLGRALTLRLDPPVTAGKLHIGGRLFYAAGLPTESYVVAAQMISNADKISMDLNSVDRVQVVTTLDTPDAIVGPPGSFARDRWICFELITVIGRPNAGARVTLLFDGAVVLDGFTDHDTQPGPGYTSVELASVSSPSNLRDETFVFDNWIVSTRPIGCP